MLGYFDKQKMVTEVDALPGRSMAINVPHKHFVNQHVMLGDDGHLDCLLYTSPSPRDQRGSRMPSSA